MEQDRPQTPEVEFQSGQFVRVGNDRWFEHPRGSDHDGIIEEQETILILGVISKENYGYSHRKWRKAFRAFALWNGIVGKVVLFDWIDEVVE